MSELVDILGSQRERIVEAAYDACVDDLYEDAIAGVFNAILAALPDEEAPPGRLKIEQLRRDAMKAAEAGLIIKLDDLT